MKAAAIIALLVSVVLGIAAIGNFVDDSAKRGHAVDEMLKADFRSYTFERSLKEANEAEAAEQKDGILGLIAVTFLIASLVMFSQAKNQNSVPQKPVQS